MLNRWPTGGDSSSPTAPQRPIELHIIAQLSALGLSELQLRIEVLLLRGQHFQKARDTTAVAVVCQVRGFGIRCGLFLQLRSVSARIVVTHECISHITQRMLYRLRVGELRSVPLDFRQLVTVTKASTLKQRLQGATAD